MRSIIGLGFGFVAAAAYGDPCCVTQASGFGGGDGTAANPFQICAAAHVNEVRVHPNANFIQTADISMSGVNHAPIGGRGGPFQGTYDGQGYALSDFGINNAALGVAGLFGVVGANGIVRDVNLQAVNILAFDFVGGIAGVNLGLIERCSVIGSVNGRDNVGGAVGQCDGGTVDQSLSAGTVQGRQFVGGLVGACQVNSTVSDSYSRSSAGAMISNTGGLIGNALGSTVQRCYSTGQVNAPAGAGGLIAFSAGSAVSDCFWDVMTSGLAASPGGGAGRMTGQMLQLGNYAPPWDFVSIWTILSGDSYPRLQWEKLAPPPIALQDLDGDGVRDDEDRCLSTIPGATVGIGGCPQPPIPFDSDWDGDVDLYDWEALESCAAGPATAARENCAPLYDRNADGLVDLWEHAAFQRCFSGENVPADASCAAPTPVIRPVQAELAACTGAPADPLGPNDAVPGGHFHRLTLDDPRALCNDGTPAVVYIHAAPPGSPNADRWLIYFQGGKSCRSFTDCAERWCGVNPPFDASKMSSRWSPNTIAGTGLFLPCLPNSFHDYNHVYLPYCSSDNYSGTNGRVVLTDETNPAQRYSLYFNGHFIVDAALAALESGAVSDDGEVQMPSIQDAVECITTGSSAGGGGAERHVDWIAGRYPNAVHYLVRDAGPSARVSLLSGPVPSNTNCITGASPFTWEEATAAEEALVQAETENYVIPHWKPFADESCLSLLPEEEHWRCNGGSYVTFNHITTPMFIRHDLRDTVSGSVFLDAIGVCLDDLALAVRESLLRAADIPVNAVEAASITVVPGAYGPQCGWHEGIYKNELFFISTVEDALGAPVTFHDALRAWLDGNAVSVVDDPAMPTSVCP